MSSGRLCSSCRDVSQQGLQAPLVRELVTWNPMACSILGCPRKHPLGFNASHQLWLLLPRLEHDCVESIDQLAWYHTQLNTLTEWRHQFCSGETRFNRYVVNPKQLAFRFGKPKKQLCPVEYLSFLVLLILDLVRWYPIHQLLYHCIESSPHRFFNFHH